LRLFADRGFAESSLRRITAEAGVNLAAVNYHFGSKEALIAEVFDRLVAPVNAERLQRLDEIEEQAGSGPLAIEEVVDAFVTPAMEAWKLIGPTAIRMMGRTYADSSEQLLPIIQKQFGPIVERFAAAMHRALPAKEPGEVLWGLQFAVGALVHTMIAHDRLRPLFAGLADAEAADAMRPRLIAFICGGMRAPAAGSPGRAGRARKRT
jgi:AcrR family transcriptional regulator